MPPQPLTRATCRATGAGEGWTLIGQLIYDANHHTNGSAVLVMGDHGTTGEGKPHPKNQPPMGKCAEACINKVKVPVLLVRGNAKALLEQHDMPVTQRRGMRTQDSRGNLHDDAPGGHGLNITVCVDGTNLSKKARLLSPYSSISPPTRLPRSCRWAPTYWAPSLPDALSHRTARSRTAAHDHAQSHQAFHMGLKPLPYCLLQHLPLTTNHLPLTTLQLTTHYS